MPLIRCDYSTKRINNNQLIAINKAIFDTSARLCNYNSIDAKNKISIFNQPYRPIDHSTASAEIEVRAKKAEFEKTELEPEKVRLKWLEQYQNALVPLVKEMKITEPIIFTVTFEDWEVIVISAEGSTAN